jgi:HlyD family secretion protein
MLKKTEDGAAQAPRDPVDALLGKRPGRPGAIRRRLFVLAAGLAAIILVAPLVFGGRKTPQYATTTIAQKELVLTVVATGNLQPTRQVDVGSETSGLITEVYVDNNDAVKAGDTLARVDPLRLQDALNQAEASLASANADVAAAAASEALARVQLRRTEDVFELSRGKTPSQNEIDRARAELQRASAQSVIARARVEQVEAQLASAKTNLERSIIYSPVDGVVLSRKVDPGQTVAAAFQTPVLFSIAEDLSKMRLDVRIDEADIGAIVEGQQATFAVDAFPGEEFPAIVERVDLGANATESSSSSSVVAYTARLRVENVDGRLRPGMTATATIVAARYEKAMVAPIAALRFKPPAPKAPRRLTVRPPDREGPSVEEAALGKGARRKLYILGDRGSLTAVEATIIAVAGGEAALESDGLAEGAAVVTGMLAPAK